MRPVAPPRARAFCLWLALTAGWALAACAPDDIDSQLHDVRRWEDGRTLADDSLTMYLDKGRLEVRKAAAIALGRIGHPDAIPALAKSLEEDRRAAVRAESAFALGLIPSPDAAAPLVAQLPEEAQGEVVAEIVLALGRLGEPGSASILLPYVHHEYPRVRENALEALALLADSVAVATILEATDDPLETVQWRATYALEKVPDERSVSRLVELLASASPLIRAFAARALGRMGPPTALPGVEGLVALLVEGEPEWRIRVNAARSLGQLGDDRARGALLEQLQDPVFHVRAAALNALSRLSPPATVQPILATRTDDSPSVRHAAYGAIAHVLEEQAFDYLEAGLDDPSDFVASRCLVLLGELEGEARARELLLAALEDEERPRRRSSAWAGLGARGGDVAIERLRAALDDEDWIVVTQAALALGELEDDAAVPALIETYALWEPRGNVDVCEAVVTALGQLKSEDSVDLLKQTLEHRDQRLRLAAREALAASLSEESMPTIPSAREIRLDVRPYPRSSEQPDVVAKSEAEQLILDTPRGRIVIDLFNETAPQTVESFARLAERGFFDGLTFHRVVPNFVIQGGDPLGTGWGDAGYQLRSEWSRERYRRGRVGIATSGKDTGSCQLFVVQSPQPHLNARYTIWGEVVEGLDVVDLIDVDDTMSVEIRWMDKAE